MSRYLKEYPWKQWKKLSWEAQEYLVKQNPNLIITGHKTKKERAIDIMNAVDITRPEGQQNFDKFQNKVDKVFKKMDDVMNGIDKALDSADSAMGKIGSNKTKSLLDDPFGKGSIGSSLSKDNSSKGTKHKKRDSTIRW